MTWRDSCVITALSVSKERYETWAEMRDAILTFGVDYVVFDTTFEDLPADTPPEIRGSWLTLQERWARYAAFANAVYELTKREVEE